MVCGIVSDVPVAIVQGPACETVKELPLDIPHFMQGLKKSGNWLAIETTAKATIGRVTAKARRRSGFMN